MYGFAGDWDTNNSEQHQARTDDDELERPLEAKP